MDAFSAVCKRLYDAYHNSGYRTVDQIKWIVLHSTEGGTAASIARYFSEPGSGGSAHLVVDDKECYRLGPNTMIMWGAPGANEQGFHIEQCGYAAWDTAEWFAHRNTLDRAAYKAAYHAKMFNIPLKFRTAWWLRLGFKGITTHAEVTKAFRTPGGHTDPGAGWPREYFMNKVKEFYAEL